MRTDESGMRTDESGMRTGEPGTQIAKPTGHVWGKWGEFVAVFCLAGASLTASLQLHSCATCVCRTKNYLIPPMKLAFIAVATAILAASCCPSAPAPSKPAYMAPSK
jgi:hypothetical protein